MMNSVNMVGRLTKDIDLRVTRSNKKVAQFTLAVNRDFTNAQGNYDADFPTCIVWDKSAEILSKYTHKGSLISVEAQVRTSSYEKDGRRIYRTDFIVNKFGFLESKSSGNNNSNDETKDGAPNDPFVDNSNPIDISDDDLPF